MVDVSQMSKFPMKFEVTPELVEPLNDALKALVIFATFYVYREYIQKNLGSLGNINVGIGIASMGLESMAMTAVLVAVGMFLANMVSKRVMFVVSSSYYRRTSFGRNR